MFSGYINTLISLPNTVAGELQPHEIDINVIFTLLKLNAS
jgi:hypothetical protein